MVNQISNKISPDRYQVTYKEFELKIPQNPPCIVTYNLKNRLPQVPATCGYGILHVNNLKGGWYIDKLSGDGRTLWLSSQNCDNLNDLRLAFAFCINNVKVGI